MRVSPNLEPDILAGIQQSEASLQSALQEVSTGKRVNLPGDDPAAAAALVQNAAASANIDQYTANSQSALGQAQSADAALSSVVSLLTHAIALGTEGASDTETPANRQSLATQIQGILSSVVADANTTYQGTSIFAGTSGAQTAFVVDSTSATGYRYIGNSSYNKVQVGDTLSVQTTLPGDGLFTNASANVLASLSQLAASLTAGNSTDIGNATAAISASLGYVTSQHVITGTAINQIDSQESYLSQEKITLSSQANDLVGIDSATAAENLVQAETQNSAVLAAAAKVLPNSLLNYLK